MSRVLLEIDDSMPQKELFHFLKENKKALIAQKKAAIKYFDSPGGIFHFATRDTEGAIKSVDSTDIPEDANSFMVDVAANTSMWCDTAMDVLLKNAAKKSMKERKGMIPHITDHVYTYDNEVGDVKNIFYQDVPLRTLGFKGDDSAQVLTFSTEIRKDYNEKAFNMYRQKRVKQHSIGLFYVRIQLAINAPDDKWYEEEYKVWQKHIDNVINKEFVETKGYFWAVPEYMLMENSAVLLGANILTPTLSTYTKQTTGTEPLDEDTQEQPDEKSFDVSGFLNTVTFNF